MDKFGLLQFLALLKREVLEHNNLFIRAPALLALILVIGAGWIATQVDTALLVAGVEYLSVLFNGLSPLEMAPVFMFLAIPFVMALYVSAFVYLINSLFQDRRDMSVLFWQSMPVSNLKTVLSKVVTIAAVAPFFYMAVLCGLYVVAMLWLTLLGASYDIEVAGLGYMFMAAFVSLALVYLSAFVSALWLLPSIGWLLLFSAFARRTPVMWAIGVLFLVGFLEDFVFGTQFLANWVGSRSNPNQYIIFSFSDVFDRLFNYDMLFGIGVGSILIAGSVYMRRFVD